MKNSFKFLCLLIFWLSSLTILSAQQTRQTILFNDNWKFFKADVSNADQPSFDDANWKTLDLPHDWSIGGPFNEQWASATAYLPAGIGWYRKTFELSKQLQSKNIFLYFDGVYKNSEVWINGHYLGKRPNGFIPFQYEITSFLNKTGKNIVAVKVDHSQFADSRWYTGSGIYRNVYLIATEAVHIDLWGVYFTTPQVSSQKATASIEVTIANQISKNTPVSVEVQLIDAKGKKIAGLQRQIIVNANNKAGTKLSFDVNHPSLWSMEHPELYSLVVTLKINGRETDKFSQQVGFRSFRFDKDKGFFLNEQSLKIKGVCIHDDAGALGVAVPVEVWIRRLKLLKEAGCNSLRMSHNPHADYLYDLADKMGFLVMDEAFDEWEVGKNKWIKGWNAGTPGNDGYHSDFKEWADSDVQDMVLRNRNHASIIMWSIGNEIDYPNDPYTHEILNTGRNPQIYGRGYTPGKPPAQRLTEIAKQLVADVKKYDTTRPVTAALAGVVMSNEVGYPEVLDIVGYNYQEFRYPDDHKKYPGRIIYGSENGMALNAWKAVEDNEYISAQYLWTGIDYLGEARSWPARSNMAGLLDLAGFKKPSYYFRQSLWTDQPMIYIATSALSNDNRNRRMLLNSWKYNEGDSALVSCFTNCDETELSLNGVSLGKKSLSDANEKLITWGMLYQPGTLLVKGYKNGVEATHYTLQTFGHADAISAKPDRVSFESSKKQLSQIEIIILDQKDIPVANADNELSIAIEGPAELIGLESGSATSHEDYKSNKRKAVNGKLLVYVQSLPKPGTIKIIITSPGLKTETVVLTNRKP
jgi:beta-galactosidase